MIPLFCIVISTVFLFLENYSAHFIWAVAFISSSIGMIEGMVLQKGKQNETWRN